MSGAFSPRRIEGYAILSEDGMLADASGVMPDALKFEADQCFFERGLDRVHVVVQGRHSAERQSRSPLRPRLIVTRQVAALSPDPSNPNAWFWNPAGAAFEQALAALEAPDARIGVVGATDVFGLFLDRYDVFFLSRVPGVSLPGGRAVFPDVPTRTPEQVLAGHGLVASAPHALDRTTGLSITAWRRRRAARPGRSPPR